MRWHQIVAEDAETDIDAHSLASDLLHKLLQHFMNPNGARYSWDGQSATYSNGVKMMRFETKTFGWPAPYDKMYFDLSGTQNPSTPTGTQGQVASIREETDHPSLRS